ncbi:FG-GAP-like repeat-containing protein [Myxococcota bacterium]|nr:FG-GAP-like repeat-containing protein [Myxococcota bacterium]
MRAVPGIGEVLAASLAALLAGCLATPGVPGDDDAADDDAGPDDDSGSDDDSGPDDDAVDPDSDGDGHPASVDCDDGDPGVHPGAEDSCGDGIDQDCDGDPWDCRLAGDVPVSAAHATFVGNFSWGNAGWSVAGAGDTDGDGSDDVVVAVPSDETGGTWAGAVYLLRGPLDPGTSDLESGADAVLVGEGGTFGEGLASGDFNEDGISDVIVGAPWKDRVYVFFGPIAGRVDAVDADVILTGESSGDQAGYAVASAGDVDRDGSPDLLVGAQEAAGGRGRAYLLRGPLGTGTRSLSTADAVLTGERTGDRAGWSVAGAGDTDGDGYGDLLIGAPWQNDAGSYAGAAYLVRGPVSGSVGLGAATTRIYSPESNWELGTGVVGPGDVDGDGLDDILIGTDAEAAYVFLGPLPAGQVVLAEASSVLVPPGGGENLGGWNAAAGDVDGDGLADILLGAPSRDEPYVDGGGAYLVYGPPLEGTVLLDRDCAVFLAAAAGDATGRGLAGAGDVDRDGFGDLVIGSYAADDGISDGGVARVYLGSGP